MMTPLILLFAVLGLFWGSFLLVLVHRQTSIKSALWGRSRCDHCRKTLAWPDLIPVIMYVVRRGRCRFCKERIPFIYPAIELLTAVSFALIVFRFGSSLEWWGIVLQLVFVSLLIMLCAHDWLHHAFPTNLLAITFFVLVAVVLVSSPSYLSLATQDPFFQWFISPQSYYTSAFKGLAVGGGVLGLIAIGSREQWMGYGDVILSAILGLWLGYPSVVMSLVVAFYLGAIVGVVLLASSRVRKDHHIAFGPFLILAAIAVQVWGEHLFYAIMRLWSIA